MTTARATPGLLLYLARRGLLESPLVLALLLAAIAAGMGFQVPNAANLAGYRAELLAQGIQAGFGDVRLRPRRGQRLVGADAIAARVAAREHVHTSVPVLTLPGAVGREGRFVGTAVSGLDQTSVRRPFRLVTGAPVHPGDTRGIVLGSALASRLGAGVGDTVQLRLILGAARTMLEDEDVGRYTMTVRGLAAGAFGVCGSDVALVDRAFLDAQTGGTGAADLILVYSDAPFEAPALASRLGAAFPDLTARPWMDDSSFIGSSVRASAAIATVTRAMVVLAVLIPVWALLYIRVLHRQRQVGLLRALGFGQIEIFAIYLLQAFLVGLAGVALGAGLGYGLVRWFQAHPIFAMEDFVLRPLLSPGIFLWPAALIFATTLAAGVLPAWRAARLDPVRALRGLE
jgi:ABC-type lipoprotein release transport system permease subunit